MGMSEGLSREASGGSYEGARWEILPSHQRFIARHSSDVGSGEVDSCVEVAQPGFARDREVTGGERYLALRS